MIGWSLASLRNSSALQTCAPLLGNAVRCVVDQWGLMTCSYISDTNIPRIAPGGHYTIDISWT